MEYQYIVSISNKTVVLGPKSAGGLFVNVTGNVKSAMKILNQKTHNGQYITARLVPFDMSVKRVTTEEADKHINLYTRCYETDTKQPINYHKEGMEQ